MSSSKVYLMKDTMILTLRTRRYFDVQTGRLDMIFRTGRQAKCKDYRNPPHEEDGDFPYKCRSKQNCIDRCLINKFIRKYNKLPSTLIFKSYLHLYGNYSFFSDRDKEANTFCRKEFAPNDCNHSIILRDTEELPRYEPNQSLWKISPFEKERDFYEITDNAKDKLYLDLFTIYTILLGINIPSLTFLSVRVCKFKPKTFKYFKIGSFFVFTFVFICYTIFIFTELLYDFHLSMFHQDAFLEPEKININICLEHGLDTRQVRTGAELERLTRNISFESLIEKIEYVDRKRTNLVVFKPGDDPKNLSDFIEIKESIFYRKKETEFKCVLISFGIDTTNLNLLFFGLFLSIKIRVGQI